MKAKGCANPGKSRGKKSSKKKKLQDPDSVSLIKETEKCCDSNSGTCPSSNLSGNNPYNAAQTCNKQESKTMKDSCCDSGTCHKPSDTKPVTKESCCASDSCKKQPTTSSKKDTCCDEKSGTCNRQLLTTGCNIIQSESCCLAGTCNKQFPAINRDSCCDETTSKCKPEKVSDCASKGCCDSKSNSAQSHNIQEREIEIDTSDQDIMLVAFTVQGMTCTDCATRLNSHLASLNGVVKVDAQFIPRKAYIQCYKSQISIDELEAQIKLLQFQPSFLFSQSANQTSEQLLLKTGTGDIPEHFLAFTKALPNVPEVSQRIISGSNVCIITYEPQHTNSRVVIETLQKNFPELEVELFTESAQEASSTYRNWRNRFVIALILCIPVILAVYISPEISSISAFIDKELFVGLTLSIIIQWTFTTPIQFYLGLPLYKAAYAGLRYERKANMDLLIIISTGTAYWYSVAIVIAHAFDRDVELSTFFETAACLMTLILLGRFLESYATNRTSRVLSALTAMQPTKAILLENSQTSNCCEDESSSCSSKQTTEREIDSKLIQVGDMLKVLPGMQVPVDGHIVQGDTAIDESMITGESVPVPKQVGSKLIGGSINLGSSFEMLAEKTLPDSTLANIAKLVENAQQNKAAVERTADRVASVFVPMIVVLALVTFVVWFYLARSGYVSTGGYSPLSFSLMFALTVLVISCPCAVSLAVPTVVIVSTGMNAKYGILVKGGLAIEQLHKSTVYVFDKTGTLTEGQFKVSNVQLNPSCGLNEAAIFRLIGSAELASEHLIGKSLSKHATNLGCTLDQPEESSVFPGKGLQATIGQQVVLVGKFAWILDSVSAWAEDPNNYSFLSQCEEAQRKWVALGQTVIGVAINSSLIALVGLADVPRAEASQVVEMLHALNKRVIMLTGDNHITAECIASQVGINSKDIISEVLPEEKSNVIAGLQSEGEHVVMIGDGINDAIALTTADVGIAIGSGSNIAIEAADVVLIKANLLDVVTCLKLTKAAFRVIKLNFTWAFLYNLVGIPIAAGLFYPLFGLAIPPALAGLSELLSSVPVILFSLLLQLYKP